jgi:hypothetical protein
MVVVWHHVPLNSASIPHSPALGPSSHVALRTPWFSSFLPYVLEPFSNAAYSSATDAEPVGSSETVNVFYPPWCHIPEDM